MAKFKRGNLDLNTNQKIRLGDSLESFFQFDGSNLIINTGVGDLSLVGNLILDGTSTLTVSGSPVVATNVTTQTSDYTAVNGDAVLANSIDSTNVITLTTQNHAEITIKKISDSTANDVIIQADSGQIENLNSITLENQYEYVKVVCDGTDWWIVSSNPIDRADL